MKKLCFVAVLVLSSPVFAQTVAPSSPTVKRPDPQARERMLKKLGGFVEQPGSRKGRVLILDTQSIVTSDTISTAVTRFSDIAQFKFDYERAEPTTVADGDWKRVLAGRDATILVGIVADDKTPSILVSPDECWAVLNVKKLGDAGKSALLSQRTVKQMYRALALVAGSASRFKIPLGGAFSVEDLDKRPDMIPMDQVQQLADYAFAHGMRNVRRVPYRTACREGWAPAPTNDIQKAVWDEAHTLPTNPLPLVKPTK